MTRSPVALVVGAGPAGSVAALVLARAGVGVRLIDRASFPRPKLCGDTLNPGALSILDRLGPGRAVRARARLLTGMVLTGPSGATVAVDYPPGLPGVAIDRRDLDLMLLEAAIAAGVEFSPATTVLGPAVRDGRVSGVAVRGRGGDLHVEADIVVAADGGRSRLARALGLSRTAVAPARWAFGGYFDGIAGVTTRGEMHIRSDGYIGLACVGELTNVCVVRARSDIAAGDGRAGSIVTRALSGDALLRERSHGAVPMSPICALGPLAVDATAAGCPGMLLAGDAAGFIDPMTGDGLRFALRGGELAAQAALDELATGRQAFGHLAGARRREFGSKWRFNRVLRSLVASPSGVALAAAVGTYWHAPFEGLVGIAADLALARAQSLATTPSR